MDEKIDSDSCMNCGGSLEKTGDYCHDKPELLIAKCSNCSLKQVLDFSHVTTKIYENLGAEDFHADGADLQIERQRLYSWNKKRISIMKDFFPNMKGETVLDFGCGSGGFIEQAQGAFKKVVGFDVSDQICQVHESNGWECYNSLKNIDIRFDIMTLFNVLEHVPEPWELLVDFKKSLSPKYFVLEVPNTDESLISIFNNSAYRKNHHASLHVYYFTQKSFKQVCERAGLEVIFETQYQRYTLANNVGWMNNGKKGGEYLYTIFNDEQLNLEYERVLVSNGLADSNFFICRAKK
jgi:SAM-dependent methyltransferase